MNLQILVLHVFKLCNSREKLQQPAPVEIIIIIIIIIIIMIMISIFVKRHKGVTSEALAAVGCMC